MFLYPMVVCAQQSWYKSSPLDYAWKNVGNAGFSADTVNLTSLAFSPSGEPTVAYMDYGNSKKATVMKFDGSSWVNIGNAGFSAGRPYYISLAFSPSDGQPYVAYSDYANSYKATVMKFNGTNWVNVGNAGFSAGETDWTSLAFNPSDGQPYVAYQDWVHSYKATVMKFNGTNWMNVGNAGFSAGRPWYICLAFSPTDGKPYVAYEDWGNSDKATVMKFNGTNWVNVGNAGFSGGQVEYTSLAFSPSDGQPYVAYEDYVNYEEKATVMKFNGTNWVNVGNAQFSAGLVYCTSLAFNTSGQPYVAFHDEYWTSSGKATLMKFDGTDWTTVGTAGFSAGEAWNTSLAFSPSGKPYVAYSDGGNFFKATVMKYDSVFVGINEQKESKLSLYPNPSTNKITLEISGETMESNLSIVNIEGQQLIARLITEPITQLDISTLPYGVYFVRLTGEKTVQVGKIVKN